MQAKVTPEDTKDKSVTWTSSDTSIASVDENGLVTVHKKNGEVTDHKQQQMPILK